MRRKYKKVSCANDIPESALGHYQFWKMLATLFAVLIKASCWTENSAMKLARTFGSLLAAMKIRTIEIARAG
jgi:hypothetical protein